MNDKVKQDCDEPTPTPTNDRCEVQLTGYVECCCEHPPVPQLVTCVRAKVINPGNDTNALTAAVEAVDDALPAGYGVMGIGLTDIGQGWMLTWTEYHYV